MSQDIEIDPDSRTIKYYDNRTEQSIREHVDSGGRVLSCEQVRVLLYEIDRLRMLVPPESERGPGFVGQGSWSVFAEKVVEERDAAREGMKQLLAEKIEFRDELSSLCEEIRILKEENDELRDELEQLGDMVSAKKEHSSIQELLRENSELHRVNAGLQEEVTRCGASLAAKKEHTNTHFNDKDNFVGITGYGQFSLKQVDKDRWEIHMLNEKVTLYNKKGHRVRGHHNHDGDW
jgi:chromosome segregation ATPase